MMNKLGSRLLRMEPEQILIGAFFSCMIVKFEGLMALQAMGIYLSDQRWKVKGCFGLYGNGFPDVLLPSIFWQLF